MYLRNSKSFIPTQAVPIPRGRPQGRSSPPGAPLGAPRGAQIPRGRPQGRPQGICDPPGCRTFCQVVQSGHWKVHCMQL